MPIRTTGRDRVSRRGRLRDGGMTQQAISDYTGVPRITIQNWLAKPEDTTIADIGIGCMAHMARRNLVPWQWGMEFEKLCEIRGIATGGKGGRPRKAENPDTMSGLAAELGTSERHARRRLRQWQDLQDQDKGEYAGTYPKLSSRDDNHEGEPHD